jgi:HD-like signal output (HDOD) protein
MSSQNELNSDETEKFLRNIQIPPRPQLLTDIDRELKRDSPNLGLLGQWISKDVSVSAAVLKIINSPFFGLQKKVGAVGTAVQMLGIKNVRCLVTGLMLKQTLGTAGASFERFWDTSERVARISAHLASIMPRLPKDEAYTFGLFREIGIPLMMQRFPDYKETLKRASGLDTPMTMVEEAAHGTNHATIGYMIARNWLLPESIAEAILLHHDPAVLRTGEHISTQALALVMINYLAEHLNESATGVRSDARWKYDAGHVMAYFGLSAAELEELQAEIEQF